MKQPEVSYWDCPLSHDPVEVRQKFENWFSERNPEVDDIYGYVEIMFSNPGVSLIDVPIREIKTHSYWSFRLSEGNLPPAALHEALRHLDILCSLHILSKHHLPFYNQRFEIDIYYVCMTDLGVEFLTKCDREVEQKLRAPPSSRPLGA
jgi:hypothetical protein